MNEKESSTPATLRDMSESAQDFEREVRQAVATLDASGPGGFSVESHAFEEVVRRILAAAVLADKGRLTPTQQRHESDNERVTGGDAVQAGVGVPSPSECTDQLPLHQRTEVTDGVALIAAERKRQVEQEGWTPEHDDAHESGALALAAASYAVEHTEGRVRIGMYGMDGWPWATEWWKPTTAIRNLVKAGALIAAEIERLQRKTTGRGTKE